MSGTAQSQVSDPQADLHERVAARLGELRTVFAGGRTLPLAWRLDQLRAVVAMLRDCEDQIAQALAQDLGRPVAEAFIGDVAPPRAEALYAIKHLHRWMRPLPVALPWTHRPGKAQVRYEPLGVVAVVAPWNYPVHLLLSGVVGALAAGNCVVLKPSELAPATSALLARIVPQYLDPQAVAVLEGDGRVTQELLAVGVDHLLFTGGGTVARLVAEQAARSLTPVTLELGGKNPVIVAADANLAVAARRIAWIKLLNAGQTCLAPDYALVEHAVQDAFVEQLQLAMTQLTADQPGGVRLRSVQQLDRLAEALQATKGTVRHGGTIDRTARTMAATIVTDPALDEPLLQEEIFGPVLPVLGVDDLAAAVAHVRGQPQPLAAYAFTESAATAERLIRDLPAGGVVINHLAAHCLVPQLPFGGVGASGHGSYHGQWGFQRFSHTKAVLHRPSRPDPRIVYPPYTPRAMALLRRLL